MVSQDAQNSLQIMKIRTCKRKKKTTTLIAIDGDVVISYRDNNVYFANYDSSWNVDFVTSFQVSIQHDFYTLYINNDFGNIRIGNKSCNRGHRHWNHMLVSQHWTQIMAYNVRHVLKIFCNLLKVLY